MRKCSKNEQTTKQHHTIQMQQLQKTFQTKHTNKDTPPQTKLSIIKTHKRQSTQDTTRILGISPNTI
jgi:hypothetical protein